MGYCQPDLNIGLIMRLSLYLYVAFLVLSYLTQLIGKTVDETFSSFENFKYLWDAHHAWFLSPELSHVLFRVTQFFSINTTQGSA